MDPTFLIPIVIFGGLITAGVISSRKGKEKVAKATAVFNEKDARAAGVFEEGLNKFYSEAPADIATSTYVRAYEGFRLGEVTRHFDTNTSAAIQGWMTHDRGIRGGGVGVGLGRLGLGVGRIGLSGTSEVSLRSSGTNRDDLMGDGFVAVLEKSNGRSVDTLRVVVQSENETREWIAEWLKQVMPPYQVYRQFYSSFERRLSKLLDFKDEASYVSDRLHSILRMAPESRPLISVYGSPLSEHAIVGAAIRFGDEERIIPLFPIALVKSITQVLDHTGLFVEPLSPKTNQSKFEVILMAYAPNKKIDTVKAVREVCHLGLAETVHLVERAPTILVTTSSQAEAELIRDRLVKAGTNVLIR